jgi:hypothetical protein
MEKLSRVLIFTYTTPKELDVKKLKEENEKYINDLYSNLNKTSVISKLFSKKIIRDTKVIFLETGIGKLNSYRLLDSTLRDVSNNCIPGIMIKVVNLGTAGSGLTELGTLIDCGRYIDVDMALYEGDMVDESTSWINKTYIYEPDGTDLDSYGMYSCNSRDMFVTKMDDSFQRRDGWKVVCETEGFSQAKCCEDWSRVFKKQIKFSSSKFITHGFNENALKEREELLPKACETLTKKASKHLFNFYYAKL